MSAKLVLASTSRYRRTLLARLGLPFEVAAPNVDETPLPGESPSHTALRLAEAKARAVAEQFPDSLIIGSDQVLLLEDEQLGKPGNFENAFKQLKKMQGNAMVFHTALCLFNSRSDRVQLRDIPTVLHLRIGERAQMEGGWNIAQLNTAAAAVE